MLGKPARQGNHMQLISSELKILNLIPVWNQKQEKILEPQKIFQGKSPMKSLFGKKSKPRFFWKAFLGYLVWPLFPGRSGNLIRFWGFFQKGTVVAFSLWFCQIWNPFLAIPPYVFLHFEFPAAFSLCENSSWGAAQTRYGSSFPGPSPTFRFFPDRV